MPSPAHVGHLMVTRSKSGIFKSNLRYAPLSLLDFPQEKKTNLNLLRLLFNMKAGQRP